MTVASLTNKVTYAGNDSASQFAFAFYLLDESHLEVTLVNDDTGAETELVLGSDFTLTGAGDPAGGEITYLVDSIETALPSGYSLVLRRVVPFTQDTDYQANDAFPAETHEEALDKLTMIAQQLKEEVDRSFKVSVGSSIDPELPTPVAGKALGWNDTEDGLVNMDLTYTTIAYDGTIGKGADASKPATCDPGDLYFATDTNKLYKCISTNTWSVAYVFDTATVNAILLENQGSGPATSSTQIGLYCKTVSSVKELFYRAVSSGAELQITEAGALKTSAVVTTITGEIRMWAGAIASPPSGWLVCDGSAINRTTYSALFAVIGEVYGVGNGSTTFNIPNFTNKFPYGANEGASAGNASVGSAGGRTPAGNDNSVTAASGLGSGAFQPDGSSADSCSRDTHTHDVMPPYLAVAFIIKT